MKKKNLSGNIRRLVRKTRATIKKPKQLSIRESISKMQKSIDGIHHAVILIENEQGPAIKAIGEGLSLNNERLDRFEKNVNQRFDVMDRRLNSVEAKVIELSELKTDVAELKADVKEIKQNTSRMISIVDNHEVRIGAVESSIKEHIDKHA